MAYQGEPPKYVQMIEAIQQRILNGDHPVGSKIPSESELIAEFGVSRQVVVRALLVLEQDGWVRGEPGRGRFVQAIPDTPPEGTVDRLRHGETVGEEVAVKLLHVGPVKAPNRAAHALGLRRGTLVMARHRLTLSAELGPVETATLYLPMDLAAGTDLGKNAALAQDPIAHLARRKRITLVEATERISARLPSADEVSLLEIGPRDVLLTLLLTAHDRDGAPRLALDVAMPATRQDIERSHPLT